MATVKIEIPDQELSDIITTAVEGGIGYWAIVRNYHWSMDDSTPTTVEVREQCEAVWHTVDTTVIARGLEVCAAKYPRVFASWLRDRIGDAGTADVILQCGLFGEAVYG